MRIFRDQNLYNDILLVGFHSKEHREKAKKRISDFWCLFLYQVFLKNYAFGLSLCYSSQHFGDTDQLSSAIFIVLLLVSYFFSPLSRIVHVLLLIHFFNRFAFLFSDSFTFLSHHLHLSAYSSISVDSQLPNITSLNKKN